MVLIGSFLTFIKFFFETWWHFTNLIRNWSLMSSNRIMLQSSFKLLFKIHFLSLSIFRIRTTFFPPWNTPVNHLIVCAAFSAIWCGEKIELPLKDARFDIWIARLGNGSWSTHWKTVSWAYKLLELQWKSVKILICVIKTHQIWRPLSFMLYAMHHFLLILMRVHLKPL